ncbi:13 TM domain-containing transmembrane protein [Acrasis kona]|uniref:13 TM domain-containing transmembrane protein n=1 Tax=Acrasis kona TaxID=1008807 RepID=A0AAW2Z3W8_9EUKA
MIKVVLFLALLMAITYVNAVCCNRKSNFGCCGNGKCNIFCCNCDDGCNQACENTHCDGGEWLKCAGVVATCAAACASGVAEAACVACLGPLYGVCKKCIVGGNNFAVVNNANDVPGNDDSRRTWYDSIASDSNKGISLEDFNKFLSQEVRTLSNGLSANESKDTEAHFKSLDLDQDGYIGWDDFNARKSKGQTDEL